VIAVGAHLDSVGPGPGINDNGSGSAGILEIAEQMAGVSSRNRVRFLWFGAEESGLLGSDHYVASLSLAQRDRIKAMLNFDMIASPNFVRFVYDGDNSTGEGAVGPTGSDQIERMFLDYFGSQGLATAPTPFDGRSDYGPFIEHGIPAGGLFSGAEGIKTAQEASVFGGVAGQPYDPCYHQGCDTLLNLSNPALEQLGDGAAHATISLAQGTPDIVRGGKGSSASAFALPKPASKSAR
jgi:Zn-dependent M28 family amino/carboxypeptidase